MRRAVSLLSIAAACATCRFDPAYRDVPEPPSPAACTVGEIVCEGARLRRCEGPAAAPFLLTVEDCATRGLVCAPELRACTPCLPGQVACDGARALRCDARGQSMELTATCDAQRGVACRSGTCVNLCEKATRDSSNIGCEYWAVDLDNAMINPSLNAAAQQFAVAISNPEPDLATEVTVEQDDASPGEPPRLRVVAKATVAPRNLEIFKLGPREVDGSPDGEFNTGTGTALTRHAYRIRSRSPIVAYQFNPLENASVFSNDASQLLPTAALNKGTGRAYVVAGWPQTIARSTNPAQNFGLDLRAFLTIVGTAAETHVHVKTTARVVPGGPLPAGVAKDGEADVVLQPFEVLNLETGDFNADFTGTRVDADQPIAVFAGSEASDAPPFDTLATRFCCADHLEEQAAPVRALGRRYALGRMPNRTRALTAAGARFGTVDEPEYFRIVAARGGKTRVTTSLPSPDDAFDLDGEGASVTLTARQDFVLEASQPVVVGDVQASQHAAGIPVGDPSPGGDPSLTYVSPIEQWRADYVFLTPDKYAFDFIVVTAPFEAALFLDGLPLGPQSCEVAPADGLTAAARGAKDPAQLVYRCQLSFPVVDPDAAPGDRVRPGRQNDGVHHLQADLPVGLVIYGFDAFVSYAYAGGTQLTEINVQ